MEMMRAVMTTVIYGLLLLFSARAQAPKMARLKPIEPHSLEITTSKTTHLIFPVAILSADRGSSDILVQKAKGAENILQVKAAAENFQETNLTVLTVDGQLYSFILNYAAAPTQLNMIITGDAPLSNAVQLSPGHINLPHIQRQAQKAAEGLSKQRGIGDKKFGIHFHMNGLFIHEDILYCRLRIENHSPIDYDIDGLRFYIRDQQKVKRTATQEIEITPLIVYNDAPKIDGGSGRTMVIALSKFTLPDAKYLTVQLLEKGGGRHLTIRVKNRSLMKAALLPQG